MPAAMANIATASSALFVATGTLAPEFRLDEGESLDFRGVE
jgi:hypothetical protein